ncbi:DUF4230 domain-containing protein [Streptomyces zhihengii]|uniref:DUF4230 domain-containing protein n=1 Tax=Streptomyces zhihengii TaxID=1818004 RepID=A0ABS2V2F3_9ACTN|nr:DUF4230 domain-containing protein [Streptomyces zhihengii]MBM9623642.1 DUF4230 domain-containing protein [Streptomyces zhihengii]
MTKLLRKSDGSAPEPAVVRGARRTVAVVVAALVCLALVVTLLVGFNPFGGLGDLFGERTEDRTGPVLLKSVRDLDRYEGAAGDFQVVVDLEKDTKFLPDAIRGTRTLFVGAGSVSAYVDFGSLREDSVRVNDDRTEATVRLPHARLGSAALDPDRSYAVSKERGLLDRLGDLFSDNPADERAVHRLAADHIDKAARESGLTARAEKNTTAMLEGLLGSLGFRSVTVVYG